MPWPVNEQRVEAALAQRRGQREVAASVVSQARGDDHGRRGWVAAVTLCVDRESAVRQPFVIEGRELALEVERGDELVALSRRQHGGGGLGEQPLRVCSVGGVGA